MHHRLILEDRERSTSAPAPVDAGDPGAAPAAVFPAPRTTIAAAVTGGLLGVGMVYGVAARLADTVLGVAVIMLVFALTMAGPRVHAAARSEVGRTVAVILESIAFGGALAAVIVLI